MPHSLIDLLWRDHHEAPGGRSRGPTARVSTANVVDTAIRMADGDALSSVTIRRLAAELDVSAMSIYTHVNSRDDLLVLMVDAAHARMDRPSFGRFGWRTRVQRVAEANLALHQAHPWLGDVMDDRTALGPGTIAKYDHELHAFDELELDDVVRDAALTFVLDFVRASGRAHLPGRRAEELAQLWASVAPRLAAYVGEDFPLAARVGSAAGEALQGAYSPQDAWRFGLDRVIDGLSTLRQEPT